MTTLTEVSSLVQALDAIMSPDTDSEVRKQAHKVIEDVKERVQDCSVAGFALAHQANPIGHRHFGLQLIEHTIKYKWPDLTEQQQCAIKNNYMSLITQGLGSFETEPSAIRDAVARCFVEMIKREWPQLWPGLLVDCQQLCQTGPLPTQLVLLTWCRICEDVVTFQSVEPVSRRREMHNALALVSSDLLQFAVSQLQSPHLILAQTGLELLALMLDWVLAKELGDLILIKLLCRMLINQPLLKVQAARCLWEFMQRKGRPEERKIVLCLFDPEEMAALLSSAKTAAEAPFEEQNYLFLKTLCCVLSGLGMQFCHLWLTEKAKSSVDSPPETFNLYLHAIMAFLSHPALVMRLQAVQVLHNFAKHTEISKNATFTAQLPGIIHACALILPKVGLPSKNDSPSCSFSRVDFDSDTEFYAEFIKLRASTLTLVRTCTVLAPWVCFEEAKRVFSDIIQKPLETPGTSWEAATKFLDAVVIEFSSLEQFRDEIVQLSGQELLKNCLSVFDVLESQKAVDPLSGLTSCLSSLMCFVAFRPEQMQEILAKLFHLATLTDKEVFKEVKTHACLVLLRCATEQPMLLLPYFDLMFTFARTAGDRLTRIQQCQFIESLAIVSNRFENFVKQSAFIGEILQTSRNYWPGVEIQKALESPMSFAQFVGLCESPLSDATQKYIDRRKELLAQMRIVHDLLKRIQLPSNEKLSQIAGFLDAQGNSVHPAFAHMEPVLTSLFLLARALNGLYSKACMQQFHKEYGAKILDVLPPDKLSMIGIHVPHGSEGDKMFPKVQPSDFVQSFLSELSDCVFITIGNICSQFQHQFFALPSSTAYLTQGLLAFIEDLIDFRRRNLTRFAMKALVSAVKLDTISPVIQPLTVYLSHMYQHLSRNWEEISKRLELNTDNDDLTIAEVFSEQMTRLLSREYAEFLSILLTAKKSSELGVGSSLPEDTWIENGGSESIENGGDHEMLGISAVLSAELSLSELGVALLRDAQACSPLVLSVFHVFLWGDSGAVTKVVGLARPVVARLISLGKMDSESASHALFCLLSGLQLHGEHDMLVGPMLQIAVAVYELLRLNFENVKELMLQVPECTHEALSLYESKCVFAQQKPPDKVRKDQFKKLVKAIIGQPLAQQFKRKVHVKQLPPLWKPQKVKFSVENLEGLPAFFGDRGE